MTAISAIKPPSKTENAAAVPEGEGTTEVMVRKGGIGGGRLNEMPKYQFCQAVARYKAASTGVTDVSSGNGENEALLV